MKVEIFVFHETFLLDVLSLSLSNTNIKDGKLLLCSLNVVDIGTPCHNSGYKIQLMNSLNKYLLSIYAVTYSAPLRHVTFSDFQPEK